MIPVSDVQVAAGAGDRWRTNATLFERAQRVMPGGVSSPVRAFSSVGGTPYFVESAKGSRIRDVEGNEYIDYVQSYGALVLGHAHPAVVEAVASAAAAGTTYGAPTEREVLLAEAICDRVPGCEQVRLTSSGTEAAMSAIRLARASTGRSRLVKFAGCYHGHSDALLAASGSGAATLGLPGSMGVTEGAVGDTLVVAYNRVPNLTEEVACVIVEPVAANMGLVSPEPGFLAGLRAACDEVGALLVFDEVITGFRLGQGSCASLIGTQPDLWCFGKVIGGGLPIGAFGGPREIMRMIAPTGGVYQAGTLSGNPVATAAGLTVLSTLDETSYAQLSQTAALLARGILDVAQAAGVKVQVPVFGSLLGIAFTDRPVRDFEGARRAAEGSAYTRFFHAMLRRGVALAPSPFEVLFPSLAHGAEDIGRTIDAAREAFAEVREGVS